VTVFGSFSILARLVQYKQYLLDPMAQAPSNNEWMLNMEVNVTKTIATVVAATLFAAGTAVAGDQDTAPATATVTTSDTAELNRNRAKSANTAAVEDAIESVRVANKLRLDIRMIDRISVQTADSR
jgi:hypothetical protein